jgi:chemotaxis protein methyltransferase CheR
MSKSTAERPALAADPNYRRLKEHAIAATGLEYYRDRDDALCVHVGRRLTELNLPDCASYLGLLREGQTGANELDKLIEQLTIGETFFFRHRESFDALRDTVLPDAIRRNRAGRRLRIWSAGCSFGAEPYSLSILLRRELAHLIDGWDISILATDINRDFLRRARRGSFEEWAFRGVPDDVKRECFSPEGKAWSIAPEFREGITFQYHNLVEHPFPSLIQNLFAFDVILCRNVMIYFSAEITRRLVAHFHDSLVSGGWLLVGHAEPNVETFRAFRAVNAAGAVSYQKREEPSAPEESAEPPCGLTTESRDRYPAAETIWAAPAVERVPPWRQPGRASWPIFALATCPRIEIGAATARRAGGLADIRRLADAGRLEQALNRCEELLAADMLDPAVHLYHALILEQLRRREETERALRRAVYLDREYVLAHYYLGLTAQSQNQPHAAARSFRNVLGILADREPGQLVPDADELRVADLERMTRMHLAALEQRESRAAPRKASP